MLVPLESRIDLYKPKSNSNFQDWQDRMHVKIIVVIQSSLTFIGVGDTSAWATLLNIGKDWIISPRGNLLIRLWIYLPITLALVFFGVTGSIMGDKLYHWLNSKNSWIISTLSN